MSSDASVAAQESRKPLNTPFKQQLLPSLQPAFRPLFFIGWFFLLAALFFALGAAIVVESDNLDSIEMRYDDAQSCPWKARQYRPGWGCTPLYVNFTITKTMKAPLFLYYKVTEFHQNNRRFVRSVSNTQLAGQTDYSAAEQNDCQPFRTPDDFVDFSSSTAGVIVNTSSGFRDLRGALYHPCGLVPWSMFNDSIALMRRSSVDGTTSLVCDGDAFDILGNPTNTANLGQCEKRGVAWNNVAGVIYNPVPDLDANPDLLTHRGWLDACEQLQHDSSLTELGDDNWLMYACKGWYLGEPGHKIPNPIDEDLWVWNRIASFATFKKLYRRITVDLPPGDYAFRVVQRWDVSSFGGTKALVLENTGWIGSKNHFLGFLFLAAGALALVFSIVCVAMNMMQPPRLSA
ncbi:Hypothetical protein, putative [Bodo saltans]|uniref:Uncharacterized protein n=1 Tax=Bodo saltans TaxID=75058 RepID=A0A0S4JB98_BODSA|nr:Hypothetical protein, putative [Bodo saltans]|eukprot:CUG88791.1 Hypothetical protein, putative [Bodo saltans]